jgi:hypothetical protein
MTAMRIIKTNRRAAGLMGLTVMLGVFGAARAWGAETSDTSNSGSSDPLLDLFIKKGFVTKEEAEKVKAEADFNRTNGLANYLPAPSKWKISDGIKNMELFGDIRVRYEDRSAEAPQIGKTTGKIDLQRERYAVRLGLRGDAFDNFYYGLRLETSSNPRSPWVTMGTSASGTPYQGPFGKSNAGIDLGQAYIGWHPESWVNVTLGRMPLPLYTTPMVWSANLNPEGAAEQFKYTVGEADFFAIFGQFVYQDTNPNEATKGFFGFGSGNGANLYAGGANNAFLLAWQGGVDYHIARDVSLKVAPVLYYYTGVGADVNQSPSEVTPGFSDVYVGQGANNGSGAPAWSGYPAGAYDGFNSDQTGINDLFILEIPAELKFKVAGLTTRFFGDYAYNFDGKSRAEAAYEGAIAANSSTSRPVNTYPGVQLISSPQIHDVQAYQIGCGIGSSNVVYGPMQGLVYGTSSARNAWELRTYWQHIEQYSLDPNLLDTDFFEGDENLQGICAAFAYGFSGNVIGTIRYGFATRINSKLGTGGSGQDIPQMNPINHFSILHLDVTVRF